MTRFGGHPIGHTAAKEAHGGLFRCCRCSFRAHRFIAAELNKDPAFAALLSWTPVAAWGAGGLILLILALTHSEKSVPAPA